MQYVISPIPALYRCNKKIIELYSSKTKIILYVCWKEKTKLKKVNLNLLRIKQIKDLTYEKIIYDRLFVCNWIAPILCTKQLSEF